MPVEFIQQQQPTGSSSDTTRLVMMYDGSGRRISKTILSKSAAATSWDTVKVTHYTGIGTEIREEFHNGSRERVSVVVNMPQGLGRYKVADASQPADDNASRTFEWYLKNHLGSTMLVYGTVASTDPNNADIGETKAAYDYRAFGEMVTLSQPSDKVTENFTGKEHDDEIALDYFGARYLDPMLGMWISVDAARQYPNPYLYAGNNPVMRTDPDGNQDANAIANRVQSQVLGMFMNQTVKPQMEKAFETSVDVGEKAMIASSAVTLGTLAAGAVVLGGPVAVGAASNLAMNYGVPAYLTATNATGSFALFGSAFAVGAGADLVAHRIGYGSEFENFVDNLGNALPDEAMASFLSLGTTLMSESIKGLENLGVCRDDQ